MIPMDLRKAIGVHPETFRRTVSDLGEFSLISVRALPRKRLSHRQRVLALQRPLGIKLTQSGQNVLELATDVRELVRRREGLLPESSIARWLPQPRVRPHLR